MTNTEYSQRPKPTRNGRWVIRDGKPAGRPLKEGDYVVATKYADGNPGDHFCVGFYAGCYDHLGQTRHLVVDSEGNPFRHNGFRRAEHVSPKRGTWMVNHLKHIEALMDRYSVWHWWRAPWRELENVRDSY